MQNTNIIFFAFITTAVSACVDLDPTVNGLLKIGRDAPQAMRASEKQPVLTSRSTVMSTKEPGCTVLPIHKSLADVDTLYGRAMTRFAFKSPEQIAMYRKTVDRTYLVDQGYKHEKQNGAFYHLAQTVSAPVSGKMNTIWLELTFSKNGTGSDVTAEFCVDPTDPLGSSINSRQKITARIQDIFSGQQGPN